MKKDLHPKTRLVAFKDSSLDFYILALSTLQTKETIEIEGKTYPLAPPDVSSASHPFYTGKQKLLDTEGRADRFMKKYKGLKINK